MTLRHPLAEGETVYLVPRTLGAPGLAWRQPRCIIARLALVEITVRLDDGTEITTHQDNISRQPITPRAPKMKRPAIRLVSPLPDDCEEIALF